jgi:hypothetical protein
VRKDVNMLRSKFPREIRDLVYGALYTKDKPIVIKRYLTGGPAISSRDVLDCSSSYPEDPSRYLCSAIVGKETAREAAQIFYGSNTFVLQEIKLLPKLLEYDHYRSAITPGKYIQRLIIGMNHHSPYDPEDYKDAKIPDNTTYLYTAAADSPRDFEYWATVRNEIRHELEQLWCFFDDSKLKELELYIQLKNHGKWDPRGIAQEVLALKDHGVKVTVRIAHFSNPMELLQLEPDSETMSGNAWIDVSSYFDAPTDEEKEMFKRPHPDQTARRDWILNSDGEHLQPDDEDFDFPYFGDGKKCPKYIDDCCNHDWHAGWYRALIADYSAKLQPMRETEFDTCKSCENVRDDEIHSVSVRVPKRDPELVYDADGSRIHEVDCKCGKCAKVDGHLVER